MTLKEYQKISRCMAQYSNAGDDFTYSTLGVSSQADDVAEKIIRDKGKLTANETRDVVAKKLGTIAS
ncbi:MAG: hypothetical protein WC246_01850 [Candidatus Paceibacterota bacterium]|jgi:hypothetical protein